MALLDVSEVLNDPLFQEPAVLIRRREAIGDDGLTVLTEGAKPIMVVATSGDGDMLAQTPTGRTLNSTVRFYTAEAISPGQSEQSADVVLWRGRRYVAISVSDWSNWGAGFTSASCQLLDLAGGTPDDAIEGGFTPLPGGSDALAASASSSSASFATTVFGDGATASFTVHHGLGSTDVAVEVRDPLDGNARVPGVDDLAPTPDTVVVQLAAPPAPGVPLRVIVKT